METNIIGIDIAKHIFQIHLKDARGKFVMQKKLRRSELLKVLKQQGPSLVGMESCGGANYWAREIRKLGHEVHLIAPQYVKPYVRGQKNDGNDAEAIAEAVSRPRMRFVPVKEVRHQDIQSLHRIRTRLVKSRTAVSNEIRGLLLEYGLVVRKGEKQLREQVSHHLGDLSNELSQGMREVVIELLGEYQEIKQRIEGYEIRLKAIAFQEESCERLMKIPGVGLITATAMLAHLSNWRAYKNGREYAASLGLVPKQHSSGGKTKLLNISKRGDPYLRSLLVHGGRAVVRSSKNKEDRLSRWVRQKEATRGHNRACVAVANKTARVIWAMLSSGEEYRKAA